MLHQVLFIGALGQVVGYALSAAPPPFEVLCLAYIFNGFGIALQVRFLFVIDLRCDISISSQDAQANGFVANLSNASVKMNLLHAAYGRSSSIRANSLMWLKVWSVQGSELLGRHLSPHISRRCHIGLWYGYAHDYDFKAQ